tara:strand:- start:54 stop:284 length:231 start_codon:yes stop_codon:yes gene_type:complete
MVGYKYDTEQEAINARRLAADFKGLPINPNDTTIYWVNYNYSELDNLYYIKYIEGLEAVLLNPIDFEITINNEPLL